MNRCTVGITALVLAAGAVQADNTIKIVDRTDMKASIPDEKNSEHGTNQFDIAYLRVDFKGKLAENTKYRLRIRLDKSAAKDKLMGASDFANYAFVDQKLTDLLSVRFGKIWTYQGGWEIDNSSSDVFLYSGVDASVRTNNVGLNPTLTVADQKIHLVLANSGTTYGDGSPRFYNYVVAYQGKVGPVQPLLSYSMTPVTGWGEGLLVAAAGLKLAPAPVGGELDLQYVTDNSVEAKSQKELVSLAGTLRYRQDALGLELKGIYDMHSLDGESTGKTIGFAPAVAYFPFADQDFRIHAAYTGKNVSPEKGSSTFDSQVFLGIKGSWSLL
ncbi:MAG: hypothetical protein H6686_00935 [Fibrobacteria bacterium]|nr:hypothetical protein [Fibrobacteria bacterium]